MKAHLIDAEEPLVEGLDYTARCGQLVSKAAFVFWMERWESEGFLSNLLCCRKCLDQTELKRYLYGLIDGEKAKHLEVES